MNNQDNLYLINNIDKGVQSLREENRRLKDMNEALTKLVELLENKIKLMEDFLGVRK